MSALAEARLLGLDPNGNAQLAETLHFASDLVDIIEYGFVGITNDPYAVDNLKNLRAEIRALRADLLNHAPNRAAPS